MTNGEVAGKLAIEILRLVDSSGLPIIAIDSLADDGTPGVVVVALGDDARELLEWVQNNQPMIRRQIKAGKQDN